MGSFQCTELLPSASGRWEHIASVTPSDNEYGELDDGWCWPSLLQYDQKSWIRTELIEYQFTVGLNAYLFQIVSFPILMTIYYSSDLLGNWDVQLQFSEDAEKVKKDFIPYKEYLFITWTLEILYHFKCVFILEVFYWLKSIPCFNFSC